MTDKKDYAAIATLEKQLTDHTAAFEQWKLDNSRQKGTAMYDEYVTKFMEWERSIRARIAEHHGLSEAGPKNIDSTLNELLDQVGIHEFMFALATIHLNDKSFTTSFVQEFQALQQQQCTAEPSIVMPRPQFYPTYGSNSFNYTPNTNAQPQVALPNWNVRPLQTTISNHRPLSPIRDFQKKNSGAPFRDFSV